MDGMGGSYFLSQVNEILFSLVSSEHQLQLSIKRAGVELMLLLLTIVSSDRLMS
jgi:hypothetical protein